MQDNNDTLRQELDDIADAADNAKIDCVDLLNELTGLSASIEQGAATDHAMERRFKEILQSLLEIDKEVSDLQEELNEWCLVGQEFHPEDDVSATGLGVPMGDADNIPHGHVPPAHSNADAFGMLDETDQVANLPGESTRIVGSDPGVDHP